MIEGEAPPSLAAVHVTLLPREPDAILGPLPNTQVAEDGSFSLTNISPDDYYITLFDLPEGYYLKSIRMGDADLLYDTLNLNRVSSGPVAIVLSASAGLVEGMVLNHTAQPVVGSTVVLVPNDSKRRV